MRPLRDASETRAQALEILDRERERLAASIPRGELLLTGASSVPGALTKGDVDLHLRVPRDAFPDAVVALSARYRVVHRDIWTDGFATFEVDDYPLPTGIALTAIGDEHDALFLDTWQRLAADPGALDRYNAAKRAAAILADDEYSRAKSDFFAGLLDGDA